MPQVQARIICIAREIDFFAGGNDGLLHNIVVVIGSGRKAIFEACMLRLQ